MVDWGENEKLKMRAFKIWSLDKFKCSNRKIPILIKFERFKNDSGIETPNSRLHGWL